jgi:hypothetical protein
MMRKTGGQKMLKHGRSWIYRTGWAHPAAWSFGAVVGGFAAFVAYSIAEFLADGLGPDRPVHSYWADAFLVVAPLAGFALVGLLTWFFVGATIQLKSWLDGRP